MMSNLRIAARSPSFSFPPLECCLGVGPSQAAKSRPFEKLSGGGASAKIVVAVIGSMPGVLIGRAILFFQLAQPPHF